MLTIRYWTRDGEHSLTAASHSIAFDQAEKAGAVRIVDACGEIFRKCQGEWVGIGFEKAPKPQPKLL